MALNTNQIEKLATDAVSTAVMACSTLDPYISSNDKTPCWDGEIFVYKNHSFCNKNLLGKVPVQVKGKERKKKNRKVTYSCNVTDLKNYYNDGGCIFFLVYINPNDGNSTEVYYRQLMVFDLAEILKNARGKNKTSITLQLFPKIGGEINDMFVSFLSDRQKQSPFIGKEIPTIQSLEGNGAKIKNLSFTVSSSALKTSTISEYLLSHETYVYAKVEGSENDIVFDKLTPDNTKIVLNGNVTIGGKTFFDRYTLSRESGEYIIQLGRGIRINLGSQKLTIRLDKQHTLNELINETSFFIELVRNKSFLFKGIEMLFSINDKNIPDLNQQIRRLQYLKDVKEMLTILGVKENLEIKKLTDRDLENLRNFTNHIIYGVPIKIANINEDMFYGPFIIANLSIWIFGYMEDKEKKFSRITSFFSPVKGIIFQFDADGKNKEKLINVSQYFLMNKEGIATASNLDCTAIYNDLVQLPKEEIYIENLIYFILDLISAYDLKKVNSDVGDDQLLQLAFDLLSWIEVNKYSEGDILCLNMLQIIKRRRPLNNNEKSQLYTILDGSNDYSVKCGAAILLEQKELALFYLNKLDEQQKNLFTTYPIYNLIEQ